MFFDSPKQILLVYYSVYLNKAKMQAKRKHLFVNDYLQYDENSSKLMKIHPNRNVSRFVSVLITSRMISPSCVTLKKANTILYHLAFHSNFTQKCPRVERHDPVGRLNGNKFLAQQILLKPKGLL